MEGTPKYISASGHELPTASQLRRMKFFWRSLLGFNFALGAYLFVAPKKKNSHEQKVDPAEDATSVPLEATTQFYEEPVEFDPHVPDLAKMQQQPTSKDQGRNLFDWLKRN